MIKEGSIDKLPELRINRNITASQVRLIDEQGKQAGIVSLESALEKAIAADMDLVEVSPTVVPVVCKILDYGKYKYRENKKLHETRARQKQVEVKETKLRLSISDGDYEVKLRNTIRFLNEGNRVKVSVWLRGREIAKQDMALSRLKRVIDDLFEIAEVDQQPSIEGKRFHMLLVPRKGNKKGLKCPK